MTSPEFKEFDRVIFKGQPEIVFQILDSNLAAFPEHGDTYEILREASADDPGHYWPSMDWIPGELLELAPEPEYVPADGDIVQDVLGGMWIVSPAGFHPNIKGYANQTSGEGGQRDADGVVGGKLTKVGKVILD